MRLIPLTHQLLRSLIQHGDHVVDATVGGGYDTLFLADCVGETGRVYGFDIQQQALEITQQKLEAQGLSERVELHLLSHERMAERLPQGATPRVIMFNLGYLPGGDHEIITCPETSLAALQCALELIDPSGIVTVMVYPAHEGGEQEYEMLASYLSALPQQDYAVLQMLCYNASTRAPQLWCIQKQQGGTHVS